jgi:hypothetical protein
VAFLVFTPSYGWYTGLLIALVAMTGAFEWAPLAFAATGAFLVHTDHDTLIYGLAAIAVAAIALGRHRARLLTRSGRIPDRRIPDVEIDHAG